MNRQSQSLFTQSADLYSEYLQKDIINPHLQSHRIQHNETIVTAEDGIAILLTLFSSRDMRLHLRFSVLNFPVYENTIELLEEMKKSHISILVA